MSDSGSVLQSPEPCRMKRKTHNLNLRLLAEYRLLFDDGCSRVPSGIYLLPSFTASHEWSGIFFVKNGLWRGGVFRFTIRFSGYPKSAPQVIFHEPLPFHPCVSDNGVFSCAFDPRIAQWQHGVFVFELLAAIKYVFYVVPEAHEHCNNHEAVEEFVSRASASVVASGVAIEDELRRSSSSDDNTDSEDAATETHSSIRFDEFEQRHADVLTLLRANGPGRAGHVKQLASLVLRKLSALA